MCIGAHERPSSPAPRAVGRTPAPHPSHLRPTIITPQNQTNQHLIVACTPTAVELFALWFADGTPESGAQVRRTSFRCVLLELWRVGVCLLDARYWGGSWGFVLGVRGVGREGRGGWRGVDRLDLHADP